MINMSFSKYDTLIPNIPAFARVSAGHVFIRKDVEKGHRQKNQNQTIICNCFFNSYRELRRTPCCGAGDMKQCRQTKTSNSLFYFTGRLDRNTPDLKT